MNPDTTIILIGVIPLGEEYSPDEDGLFRWPNKYSDAIAQINEALQSFAADQSLLHYADCGDDMLIDGQVSSPCLFSGMLLVLCSCNIGTAFGHV